MAFSCKQLHAAPTVARPNSKRACTVVASALPKTGTSKASLAAAGAALLLATSSPAFAAQPAVAPMDPVATIASETAAGSGDKGFFTKLLDSIPSAFPKVNEDPFGADRAQEKTIADTKRPIAIPTEQEAVAPEAYPNPSELRSPVPPVLAAAAGDENLGPNAGQFSDLDASGRQALIDKKSPAGSSNN